MVTVIATGFEKEFIQEERMKTPVAPGPAAGPKSFDKPTFLRKIANAPYQEKTGLDDEWDVPTFLRKQAD